MNVRKKYVCNTCGTLFDEPEKKKGRFGGLMEVCPKCGHKFSLNKV
jgi:DNA-directed RNA polymerase subunit RPC12/RpoP